MRNLQCFFISSWLCIVCVHVISGGTGKSEKKISTPVTHRERCSERCYPGPGKCYKLCSGAKTIRHAAISCVNHGATILNIEIPGEVTFISNLIAKEQPGKPKWHVGGKLIKGSWYWFSTVEKRRKDLQNLNSGGNRGKKKYRTIRKPIFANSQEALSFSSNKKCLTLVRSLNETGKLVFLPDWCSKRKGINFICQRESLAISKSPDTHDVCGVKAVNTATILDKGTSSKNNIIYKITGGHVVSRGDIPWQARIVSFHPLWDVTVHEGGATIISEFWLLTAAHCLAKVTFRSLLRVVVGDHDGTKSDTGEQVFEIEKVIFHPKYVHKQTMAYDIALILVKPKNGRGILFNQYVQPACLPSVNITFRSGLHCSISGWGSDLYAASATTQLLRVAEVPLVDKSTCKQLIRRFSKRRMLCAGYPIVRGVDTTNGDSGGPLICPVRDVSVVAGVTAFGRWPFGHHPGGYTKVRAYLKWIHKSIKKNSKRRKQRKLPKWPNT